MAMAFISEEDVAMVEHKALQQACLLEGDHTCMVWYATGIHDMASMMMEAVCVKYPNDEVKS